MDIGGSLQGEPGPVSGLGCVVLGSGQGHVRVIGGLGAIRVGHQLGRPLAIEGRDGGEGGQRQVLGVGVVGVHSGSSLGQGSEMLLGGGGVVWVKGGHSSVGVNNKLTSGQAGQGQNSKTRINSRS